MAVVNFKAAVEVSLGRAAIVVGGSLRQIIKQIFANSEQGFAYDPNDLSTLFQDAAGTIPVTAVTQPVGLMLDKSKSLALGNNAAVNGDFSNGKTGWTDVSAWWSIVDGRAYHPLSSLYKEFNQSLAAFTGKWVEISFDIEVVTGVVVFGVSAASNMTNTSAFVGKRTIKFYCLPTATSLLYFARWNGNSTEFYIDNVTIKEITGNHAYQPTSASRPTLQRNATTGAYYLAFDGIDDFLVTNNINFTTTDKVTVIAAVRKLSDAATAIVCELSSDVGTNNGSFYLAAPVNTSVKGFSLNARGTIVGSPAHASNILAPISAVICEQVDLRAPLKIRVNAITYTGAATSLGTGNYGNYPLYIGRRGGTTMPFNGHLYSLIGVSRLTTDIEITAIEKTIAKTLGVTLSV